MLRFIGSLVLFFAALVVVEIVARYAFARETAELWPAFAIGMAAFVVYLVVTMLARWWSLRSETT